MPFKMKRKILLLIYLLTGFTSLSHAQKSQEKVSDRSPIKLLLGVALELGGYNADEIFFTNGDSQPVRTAQGISVGVGTRMQLPSIKRFALDATIGFKYVTTAADNAHIRLTRIPMHLIGHGMISDDWSAGLGMISHQHIRYRSDGISQDLDFNNTLGVQFQVASKGISLHYTKMNYQDQNNRNYKANAFGLSYYATIPG